MKSNYIYSCAFIILVSFISKAQVGIATSTLDAGAIFQVESNDKGVLIPRINLTSTIDQVTIANPAVGLMIYNTSTVTINGNDTSVTPGLYYWAGAKWTRIFTQGWSRQFTQTSQNVVNTLGDIPINGLDQNITVPSSGIYRVSVTSYFGAAQVRNTNQFDENVATASIRLDIDGATIAEKLIPTFSKFVDDTATGGNGSINFFALSRQAVFHKDVELIAGQNYNFNVIGRLWDWSNVNPAVGGFTYFGLDTSLYARNPGLTDNASRTKLTINLVQQY